jgi:16S rRNA (cytosine967-C5)-methyltransferase
MSTSAQIRADAARAVASVLQGRSLDTAVHVGADATAQERGLLRALCFDSIRWYLRLDALLKRLLTRPNQKLAPEVHALAIVGLCQLLYTQIPAHAAVAETVNAARLLDQARAAGLINALLRRFLRERDAHLRAVDAKVALRTAHPAWLADMLAADWPGEYTAILEANNERPPLWLRVNRLRISGADYRGELETQGHVVAQSLFDDESLRLERAVDVSELPGFAAGQVSVQDAAAQLAARMLDARAGERVLDACAAPGGKTGHILELQPELSELIAVDVSADRMERVRQNLTRLGLSATLVTADAAEGESWWDGRPFDRILLDVPCSATGVIRRHPDIKLLRRREDIEDLARRQAALLRKSWSMLAPGGRLVYASCSALRVETSRVIKTFLAACEEARDITKNTAHALGFDSGAGPGWRIRVGTVAMDGFYYAVLEKASGT